MKLKENPLVYRIAGAVLLPFAVLLVARVFGYDVFDRGGWSHGIDGSLRYLSYEGEALLGWQEIEGETYYFSPEKQGVLVTGWLETGDGRYFLNGDGVRATGWETLEDTRYHFDENGRMSTGWTDLDDDRYYFFADGTPATGWLESGQGRFYFDKDGRMATGWLETEEGLCYLSEDGAVDSGWVETDRGRCYIDPNGIVHTGWLETEGETYYLTEEGVLHTGWLEEDGDRYYFRDDGTMAVGEVVIDGVARHFASTGKYFVLVNRWNFVPEDYAPDLVPVRGYQIDRSAYDALMEMTAACEAAGFACDFNSVYRSYDYQTELFQRKVTKLLGLGYTQTAAELETSRSIAIPGTSEHQLGLAVDLKNGYSTYDWLAENSWKYGFILRYPDGTTHLTGIYYEPWHYRYVGEELAKELYDLGICLEAYVNLLTEGE